MSRIFNSILINRPIDQVYQYMTMPDNWSQWHRRVMGVRGATNHCLMLGEKVTEEFTDAGRPSCVIWQVKEIEETRRWVIVGDDPKVEESRRWVIVGQDIIGKDAGRVAFTFKQISDKTLFERENTYAVSTFFGAVYDWLIIRFRKKAEAAEAMGWLKNHLEK